MNAAGEHEDSALQNAKQAILVQSSDMPEGSVTVEGYDFNKGIDYEQLLGSFARTGFQALHFGQAVEQGWAFFAASSKLYGPL